MKELAKAAKKEAEVSRAVVSNNQTVNATRRDGIVISLAMRVTCDFDRCTGRVFIVQEIVPFNACESGYMVLVHLEGTPDRVLKGSTGHGLDTNWFHPFHDEAAEGHRSHSK